MTLEKAIEHCKDIEKEKRYECAECMEVQDYRSAEECNDCAEEHKQLAEWLTELKRHREMEDSSDDGWVKCCVALPEEGRRVFVCYVKQHGINKGKRAMAIGYIINENFWGINDEMCVQFDAVTHWRSLPDYPVGDNEEKPVVRCGECLHMKPDGHCSTFADKNCRPSASDYCSYGERRM